MPLDPKFETSAGLQRFREQILRENKSRIVSGQKASEAAVKFLEQRKKVLEDEKYEAERTRNSTTHADSNAAVANASRMGVRGTAGRSGVVSCTQRHVVDEGYDMVLKTEWGAATEGVSARDPVFLELNEGTIGKDARTVHAQREESARRISDTRAGMIHDKQEEQAWVEKAHRIVDEGWERATHASLSRAAPSDYQHHTTITKAELLRSSSSSTNSRTPANGGVGSCSGSTSRASPVSGMSGVPGSTVYISGLTKHGSHGLKSGGVRAPTYTKERHEELTRRVRSIYDKPPPPQKDIFAALDHITKTSLPKRDLQLGEAQRERRDRIELETKVDSLTKQLATERATTANMVKKLDEMTKLAAQP